MTTHDLLGVLLEVGLERNRQDEKWGEQNHPDGTGKANTFTRWTFYADLQRTTTDLYAKNGMLVYADILAEEVAEAFAEDDKAKLREELIQVAAVAVAWIEKLDRETA